MGDYLATANAIAANVCDGRSPRQWKAEILGDVDTPPDFGALTDLLALWAMAADGMLSSSQATGWPNTPTWFSNATRLICCVCDEGPGTINPAPLLLFLKAAERFAPADTLADLLTQCECVRLC